MSARTFENWVDSLQAQGRYTFLRSEAQAESGLSPEAVKKALQRSVARGRVAKVKNYFYVIVPLEYRAAGAPPPAWFIDGLMLAMGRPYYVGLLSAAGIHGASHQQPQEFQVMTDRPVRPLCVGRSTIRFFTNNRVTHIAVQSVTTPTGTMRVSTPEATAVDVVRFARAVGPPERVADVLRELAPLLDPMRLRRAGQAGAILPTLQRLGYLLERVRARRQARSLHAWIATRDPGLVPLRPGRNGPTTNEDRRWHVLVGEPVEIEP